MATHQEIANVSDQELIERMVMSHGDRFDENFWQYFNEFIATGLGATPTIVDVGCGPGLFLRDLGCRYPGASLTGTDVTAAMISYASELTYTGMAPTLLVHDITEDKLPIDDRSVDLLSMVAVLHVLNNPYAVCDEILRVLSDTGVFILEDWVRSPLPDYLDRMIGDVDRQSRDQARRRLMGLFAVHNKYTVDDWLWLLRESGFTIERHRQLRSPHFCTFLCRRAV